MASNFSASQITGYFTQITGYFTQAGPTQTNQSSHWSSIDKQQIPDTLLRLTGVENELPIQVDVAALWLLSEAGQRNYRSTLSESS